VERADELGVRGFVEASRAGRRLYESCGFVVTEEVVLDGGKVRAEWEGRPVIYYSFMERQAKGRRGEEGK